MKATFTIWLLAGALVASAGLNVYYARTAGVPAKSDFLAASASPETRPVCNMVEHLGLTESQRSRLSGCCKGTCARQRHESGERMRDLLAALERELNAESLDRQRVAQLADEVAALRTVEWKDRIQCVLQVSETLTREQRQRLLASATAP
jgi:Spy/CpxP family protein refolding chaperone